jgi:FkbM family methyltransferase
MMSLAPTETRRGLSGAVAAVLFYGGQRLINLGYRLCPPPPPEPPPKPTVRELAFERWLAIKGDKNLRLEYELDAHSVVFDVGGYEGQWASDIFSRYLCRIHIFEPVPDFADAIAHRFSGNSAIKLHRAALGVAAGEAELSVSEDASSFHVHAGNELSVRVTTLEQIMVAEGIDEVTLMKINIEGAEYDLLDHLIASGLVRKIRSLQVQFHDFVNDAEARKQAIQVRLRETHRLTYEYPFVWESWERI